MLIKDPKFGEATPEDNFQSLQRLTGDVCAVTQASQEVAINATVAAMSFAVMRHVDVEFNGYKTGTNICTLTLAETGERKDTVDSLIFKSVYEYEQEKRLQNKKAGEEYKRKKRTVDLKNKAIEEAYIADYVTDRYFNSALENKLLENDAAIAKPTPMRREIINDVTEAAFYNAFNGRGANVILLSADAEKIFKGYLFRNPTLLTSLWSGKEFISIDRVARDSFIIEDPRFAAHLSIQPKTFEKLMDKKWDALNDIGFLARNLTLLAPSLQGTRNYNPIDKNAFPSIDWFHKRLSDLLKCRSFQKRMTLTLSPQAEQEHRNFLKEIEQNMNGLYFNIRPFAARFGEQTLKLAAVIHFFCSFSSQFPCAIREKFGEVDIIFYQYAKNMMQYYINQTLNIFEKYSQDQFQNSLESLKNWLKDHGFFNGMPMPRSYILQNGPEQFRKISKLKEALDILQDDGFLVQYKDVNRRNWIQYSGNYPFSGNPVRGASGLHWPLDAANSANLRKLSSLL